MILVAQMSLASRADGQANQIQAEPTRTAKERLGRKASDEQRIDNCKVPPALRDETWSRALDWLVRNRLLAPGYILQP